MERRKTLNADENESKLSLFFFSRIFLEEAILNLITEKDRREGMERKIGLGGYIFRGGSVGHTAARSLASFFPPRSQGRH